mgnify:CR=1 FL=1
MYKRQAHAIIGTKGFDFIDGLDPAKYDFQVFKGIEIDKHPYGIFLSTELRNSTSNKTQRKAAKANQ